MANNNQTIQLIDGIKNGFVSGGLYDEDISLPKFSQIGHCKFDNCNFTKDLSNRLQGAQCAMPRSRICTTS